jgi:mRNA interferase RelE/StbE
LTWRIEWDNRARRELRCLDFSIQNKILDYLDERIINNPRDFGRGLVGDKAGLWRYRIGDYRVICRLENNHLVVFVLEVGHRKEIYD